MTVALPTCTVVFGSVTPAEADVRDLTVHLGATKEVSSFTCELKNFDKKYSPSGTYPILIGATAAISAGRTPNKPLLLTGLVEDLEATSGFNNSGEEIPILIVSGRCYGERIYRKLVTEAYESKKGEWIFKHVIENYVDLEHTEPNDATGFTEDLTLYKKADPNKRLTLTSSQVSFTDLSKNETVYVLASKGTDHFGVNITKHDLAFQITGTMVNFSSAEVYMLANAIGDCKALEDAAEVFIHIKAIKDDLGNLEIRLYKYEGGSTFDLFEEAYSDGKWYYLRISKTGGSIQCKIYSDAARTVLLDTLNIGLTQDRKFRYVYALSSYNSGTTGDINGAVKDINLYEKELIENTSTTYAALEYENTPVDEILRYVANSADDAGTIGYDFRIRPDTRFEFFPRNSKTSSVTLIERLEVSTYKRSISRKRDKITVYGAAEKKYPTDGDAWTETLDIDSTPPNDWTSGTGTGSVSLDGSTKAAGTYAIKHTTGTSDYYGTLLLSIPQALRPDTNRYPTIQFLIRRESAFSGAVTLLLEDHNGKQVFREFNIQADKWVLQKFKTGKKNRDEWTPYAGTILAEFDWTSIAKVRWDCHFSGTGTGSFWVDNFFFDGCRWSAIYGTGDREYSETDEELHNDNECLLRAKALYDYLSGTAELINLKSSVADYGTTPILAADKIHIEVINENINGDYRIHWCEYHFTAETDLNITLEVGREPQLLADYLYRLRSKVMAAARYKVARA